MVEGGGEPGGQGAIGGPFLVKILDIRFWLFLRRMMEGAGRDGRDVNIIF